MLKYLISLNAPFAGAGRAPPLRWIPANGEATQGKESIDHRMHRVLPFQLIAVELGDECSPRCHPSATPVRKKRRISVTALKAMGDAARRRWVAI